MMLISAFKEFVGRWLARADEIQLTSLDNYFDKFFTLFVVYNRLYIEAAFTLASNGQVDIYKKTSFPDREGATSYIAKLVGADKIVSTTNADPQCVKALEQIAKLIEQKEFAIKLHPVTGKNQPDEDMQLLQDLRSANQNAKAIAILDMIYSIRCNTFHGQKGFEDDQIEILGPAIVLLRKIIELLREQPINARML
jgi:hypothetical protein